MFQLCFVTGLAVLALNVILGGLSDFFSIDLDVDLGDHLPHGVLGLFSPTSIAGFLIAFGGMGWFFERLGVASILMWSFAIVSGLAAAILLAKIISLLKRFENTSAPEQEELVGRPAEVVNAIPASGFGSIRYTMNGNSYSGPAKSYDQVPLAQGTAVAIVELKEHVFYVTSMETEE